MDSWRSGRQWDSERRQLVVAACLAALADLVELAGRIAAEGMVVLVRKVQQLVVDQLGRMAAPSVVASVVEHTASQLGLAERLELDQRGVFVRLPL